MGVLDRVVIVEEEGTVLGGEFGVSHCNQWGLCDALFSNYFEDLLYYILRGILDFFPIVQY